MSVSEEAILADVIEIMKGMADWEYSEPISRETRFFADLGFESIDAVVFGEAIEAHYRRRFPYNEFLAQVGFQDIQMGQLVDFIRDHLDHSAGEGHLGGGK